MLTESVTRADQATDPEIGSRPSNREIAGFLSDFCTLMELGGTNPFRVRAYASGVRAIESLEHEAARLVEEGKLGEVKGIGTSLADFVTEFVQTGTAAKFEELKSSVPAGLFEMLKVQGLGAKKILQIHKELSIDNLESLAAACRGGKLSGLSGFGAKTEANILKGIEQVIRFRDRFRIDEAEAVAAEIQQYLASASSTIRVSVAGSLRRRKELIKDIDLVASTEDPEAVMSLFVAHPRVVEVLVAGETKTTVLLESGIQADLRLVEDRLFPCLLHHLTGSKEHNVLLRARANTMGIKVSEWGLFREAEQLECGDEEALFGQLGLAYIPPELREGLGEIEAAEERTLPELITEDHIRGMLHLHSTYSDGSHSLEAMARAIQARGFSYMGISDHSRSAAYAGGLQPQQIQRQHAEIELLNRQLEGFRIFKGIESDILADGSLDYDDEVIDSFDYVVASIHSGFGMKRAKMTQRLIRAVEHPRTTILGHLTGRRLLEREGYEVDVDAVIAAAAENEVAIEINANPRRLDMDWRYARLARDRGVKIAVNTDAHSVSELNYLRYGIGMARKAWLRRTDVINTMETEAIADYFA